MLNRIVLLFICIPVFTLLAQESNHPELAWKTFETEHFIFHYYDGVKKSANRFANVAEQVYPVITQLYGYAPKKKMRIVIKGYDDYANGGAYYYNNKIELWTKNLDTELRGTHNWYQNVFTHEFSHMIQLHTSKKLGSTIPGVYLQWTAYEDEKREDVLTGFPNQLASYSLPMNVIPGWFAEGVAQNQHPNKFNYDFLDANRDMLFRERLLSGNIFDYDKLSDFGNKTSHEAETVYNIGFNFVRYLFDVYGEDVTSKISVYMGKIQNYSFESALEYATGKDYNTLYQEFLESKQKYYREHLAIINSNSVEGKNVSDSAMVNSHPRISPSGRYLAYLSTKDNGEATFYARSLYVKDLQTDSVRMIVPIISGSSFSWASDDEIYYGRHEKHSIYGNSYYDLFSYNLKEKKERQITEGKRAYNPAISPDSTGIAFVSSIDGTQNLYYLDLESKEIVNLTKFDDGTQFYIPRWSSNSEKIIVTYSNFGHGSNLIILDKKGNVIDKITSPYTFKHPVFSKDQKSIFYANDQTGIYNIYQYNLATKEEHLLTNVRGGAFYPEPAGNELYFINYSGIKMHLHKVPINSNIDKEYAKYKDYQMPATLPINTVDYASKSKNYFLDYQSMFIIPRIAFDNHEFKPGLYFAIGDYLDKITAFGGFAVGLNKDYDIFGSIEARIMLPTMYTELYHVVKHDQSSFRDSSVIVDFHEDFSPIFKYDNIDYTYKLNQIDAGLKMVLPITPTLGDNSLGNVDVKVNFSKVANKATADDGRSQLTYTYYKNEAYSFHINLNKGDFGLQRHINPRAGRNVSFRVDFNDSELFDKFDLDNDYHRLKEIYNTNRFFQYSLNWKEYWGLPLNMGLMTKIQGSYLAKDSINDFYNQYIGGITGLRGYSFYSIGGTRTAVFTSSLRFPIIKSVHKQYGFFNLKNVYGGIFLDVGSAYSDNDSWKDNIYKDIGANIRVYGVSFYGMPTAIDFTVAYGLDDFTTKTNNKIIEYNKEIRTYLTLLFGFMDF